MLRERTANMSRGPLYWTPTIEGLFNYEYLRDNPGTARRSGLAGRTCRRTSSTTSASRSPTPTGCPTSSSPPIRRPTLARKFKQLSDAGVVMLVGTDSGIPMNFHSSSTWRELDAWVNILGVPPMQAIRGATYWPSVAMKVDKDVGTVTPGKYADIIAVKGDVLAPHRPAAARGSRGATTASRHK